MINVDNSGSKSLDEIRDLAKQLGIDYNTKTTKKRLVDLIEGERPDLLIDQKCFKWAVLSCLHPADDHPYVNKIMLPMRMSLMTRELITPLKSPMFKNSRLKINSSLTFLDGNMKNWIFCIRTHGDIERTCQL